MTTPAELELLEALAAQQTRSMSGRATGRERGRSLASYYRADANNVLGRRFPATPRDRPGSTHGDEITPAGGDAPDTTDNNGETK